MPWTGSLPWPRAATSKRPGTPSGYHSRLVNRPSPRRWPVFWCRTTKARSTPPPENTRSIYRRAERNVYIFLAAVLIVVVLNSIYLLDYNRRMFDRVEALSHRRSELDRKSVVKGKSVDLGCR